MLFFSPALPHISHTNQTGRLSPGRPALVSARLIPWGTGLNFQPPVFALSPEGKVLTRESQPSTRHGGQHTDLIMSHECITPASLDWRYRHPTLPQARTSQEKKQVKLTHTPLTLPIAFSTTTLPYRCGLPSLPPDATALPPV